MLARESGENGHRTRDAWLSAFILKNKTYNILNFCGSCMGLEMTVLLHLWSSSEHHVHTSTYVPQGYLQGLRGSLSM